MKKFFAQWISKLDLREFIRYCLIGGLNTVVDFVVFWLLNGLAGMAVTPAQVISFLAATVNSFLWNRSWTFMQNGRIRREEVLRYCLGKALYLLCNLLLLKLFLLLMALLLPENFLPESWKALVAKLPCAAVLLFFNYFYDKLTVFRGEKKK